MSRSPYRCVHALFSLFVLGTVLAAGDRPVSLEHAPDLAPLDRIERAAFPSLDVQALLAEDVEREAAGMAPRFAVPHPADLTPNDAGNWETLGERRVWRLRVGSPGADSINLGFTRYRMPVGGELRIFSPDGKHAIRPFTAKDNAAHGELWTPPLPGGELVIEVVLPATEERALDLKLGAVNIGYRPIGSTVTPRSGSCNVDVVCPLGDGWRSEIPSVAAISTGGSIFCTGFMVNNTGQDQTPYFMTANHCGVNSGNAASLVTYWNFETSTCGGTPDGSLADFETGAFFRANYSPSDFTLVELDSLPNPAYGVTYAGWDRSSGDFSGATAIHHPSGDEKRISFEYQATQTTSYLGTSQPGDGTHVRIVDWDDGTTEPGSSGSPLFNPNHQVIGQLHGGYAACGNNDSDWYGRFSVSWTGGGTSATRLSDWLDPLGTGQMTLGTLGGAPAVVYDSHTVDDSAGNNDGVVDPGEALAIEVTARNVGGEDASQVTGTLSSGSPVVHVTAGQTSYPDLASQASAPGASPFQVTIDPAAICGEIVDLDFDTTAAETPGAWSSGFSMQVGTLAGDATSFFDDMESGTNGWTPMQLVATNPWSQTTSQSYSPTTSWKVADIASVADSVLVAPALNALPANSLLRFQHRVASEDTFDGGVLEVSTDGGASWLDAGSLIVSGGYTDTISTGYSSPLGGRQAWSGATGGFVPVEVDLASLAGQDVLLRWRFATDSSVSSDGWYLDDVTILVEQYVCSPVGAGIPGEVLGVSIDADPSGFLLSWSPPAGGGSVDEYLLYAVPMGDPSGQPACQANLGSATSIVLPALPDDTCFLVGARNTSGDGTLGLTSYDTPRPAPSSVCP